jgi:hypothetical protein
LPCVFSKVLTDDYILKIAALDEQTGESAPTYLHDGDSALDAQSASSEAPALPDCGQMATCPIEGKSYRLILVRETDPNTGETRLVQK